MDDYDIFVSKQEAEKLSDISMTGRLHFASTTYFLINFLCRGRG